MEGALEHRGGGGRSLFWGHPPGRRGTPTPNPFYCHIGNNESTFFPVCQDSEPGPRGDLPFHRLAPWPPFLERGEKSGGGGLVRPGQETSSLFCFRFSSLPHPPLPTWGLTDTCRHQQDRKQDPHNDGDHHQGPHPILETWRNRDFISGSPPEAAALCQTQTLPGLSSSTIRGFKQVALVKCGPQTSLGRPAHF